MQIFHFFQNIPSDIQQYIKRFLYVHERKGIPVSFGKKLLQHLRYPRDPFTWEQIHRISYFDRCRLTNQVKGFHFRRIDSSPTREYLYFRRSTMQVQYYVDIKIVENNMQNNFNNLNYTERYYSIVLSMFSQWGHHLPFQIVEKIGIIVKDFQPFLEVSVLGYDTNPTMIEIFWTTIGQPFETVSKSSILLRVSRFLEHLSHNIHKIS
jgi:hypothetical protein